MVRERVEGGGRRGSKGKRERKRGRGRGKEREERGKLDSQCKKKNKMWREKLKLHCYTSKRDIPNFWVQGKCERREGKENAPELFLVNIPFPVTINYFENNGFSDGKSVPIHLTQSFPELISFKLKFSARISTTWK